MARHETTVLQQRGASSVNRRPPTLPMQTSKRTNNRNRECSEQTRTGRRRNRKQKHEEREHTATTVTTTRTNTHNAQTYIGHHGQHRWPGQPRGMPMLRVAAGVSVEFAGSSGFSLKAPSVRGQMVGIQLSRQPGRLSHGGRGEPSVVEVGLNVYELERSYPCLPDRENWGISHPSAYHSAPSAAGPSIPPQEVGGAAAGGSGCRRAPADGYRRVPVPPAP